MDIGAVIRSYFSKPEAKKAKKSPGLLKRLTDKFIRKLYRYMQYLEGKIGDRKRDKSHFFRQNKYYIDSAAKKRAGMRRLC